MERKTLNKQTNKQPIKFIILVASLCYQTSATAERVVLDGFLTYNSSTSACSCSLTSTQSTNVSFFPINSTQPNYVGCNSAIRINSGGTSFVISCFVSGTIKASPSDTVSLAFERPLYGYNSDYCVLLSPGNINRFIN